MPADARERLLESGYACVARYGIAKSTVEDVAREAKVSRATVYRYFPGGKDQLIHDVVAWEMARFFARLGQAVAGAPTFEALLEEALVFAHAAVVDHAVLQKILQTEPDLLLPHLTVESERLLGFIRRFLLPYVDREAARLPAEWGAEDVAEYLARMVLSFIGAQGRWDLTDRVQVGELVRTELLSWRLPADG